MKKATVKKPKDMRRNEQFKNAFRWLQAMKVVKSAKHLAQIMKRSEATISSYMQMKRPVSAEFANAFEEQILKKQKPPCYLKDFELDIMIRQTKQLRKRDVMEMMELVTTQLTVVEGGVQTILDQLEVLDKRNKGLYKLIGELLLQKS